MILVVVIVVVNERTSGDLLMLRQKKIMKPIFVIYVKIIFKLN
jgi:hypothetical protein